MGGGGCGYKLQVLVKLCAQAERSLKEKRKNLRKAFSGTECPHNRETCLLR